MTKKNLLPDHYTVEKMLGGISPNDSLMFLVQLSAYLLCPTGIIDLQLTRNNEAVEKISRSLRSKYLQKDLLQAPIGEAGRLIHGDGRTVFNIDRQH